MGPCFCFIHLPRLLTHEHCPDPKVCRVPVRYNEASITFLGFGLSSESPAVGVILSESMKYLAMGRWWLALFPGLFLVFVVVLFHYTGDTLGRLLDPGHAHQ